MERCGAPGVKSNIKDVEWIRPQIHATPIQIDRWAPTRTLCGVSTLALLSLNFEDRRFVAVTTYRCGNRFRRPLDIYIEALDCPVRQSLSNAQLAQKDRSLWRSQIGRIL